MDLLEGLVLDLIRKKWNSYIKHKFYQEFVLFFCYFILSATVLIMKRYNFNYLREDYACTETEVDYTKLISECQCSYTYMENSFDYVSSDSTKKKAYDLNVLPQNLKNIFICPSHTFALQKKLLFAFKKKVGYAFRITI